MVVLRTADRMSSTTDSKAPIGVFDSGMGGLTVLRALEAALPGESFIYLGDTARLPYGSKSPGTVERYALQASRAYPQEAQAHSILGVTSIINKKYSQAYQQFSEYDRLLPGNPEIVFFQGLAMEGMEKKKEAAQLYYRYLQQTQQGSQAQYA